MEIQINCQQGLYRKMELSQRRNKEYSLIISNEAETSLNRTAQKKVQRGISIQDAYSIMKSSGTKLEQNLAAVSENLDKRVDTERYYIESTSEIAGYWQIYDKTLNQTFVFNPDTTTLQTDNNTDKNYIVFKNTLGGLENVMYADGELLGALKQFLNTDNIPTTSLNENYVIDVDPFTGIESLKIKGNEGAGSWNLICNEEQKEKLQELANLYKEKYPNLVKTDGVAMAFAQAEVAGQSVRTENGIISIACNGLSYMDNAEPSKSWHIMYSINDTDMYTEIMNAMAEGYIIGKDIENVSKWEKYFEEKELSYERILSDEELELLQMNTMEELLV